MLFLYSFGPCFLVGSTLVARERGRMDWQRWWVGRDVLLDLIEEGSRDTIQEMAKCFCVEYNRINVMSMQPLALMNDELLVFFKT